MASDKGKRKLMIDALSPAKANVVKKLDKKPRNPSAAKEPQKSEERELPSVNDRLHLLPATETRPKSFRLRGLKPPEYEVKEKPEIPKITISLTKEEIEEDFLAMIGSRPSKRPNKRAKDIQKKSDQLSPGLWLSSMTLNSYKVSESS
ncbi:uncharacterized protein [Aristolochia californica]|uniref:uncharacterized protein n=1 Tax=Aristolochia californica TaxID=171875 RepID=UPI0035DDD82C